MGGCSREKGGGKLRYLEMVNEGFHAFLHRSTWGWNQFVIIDLNRTGWDLVQALEKHRTRLESPEGNLPPAALVPG